MDFGTVGVDVAELAGQQGGVLVAWIDEMVCASTVARIPLSVDCCSVSGPARSLVESEHTDRVRVEPEWKGEHATAPDRTRGARNAAGAC